MHVDADGVAPPAPVRARRGRRTPTSSPPCEHRLVIPLDDGDRDRRGRRRPSTSSTRRARPDIARALVAGPRRRRPGRRGHRRGPGPGLRAVAHRRPPRPARGLGLPGGHELGPVDPPPAPAQRPPPLRPADRHQPPSSDPDLHAALGELDVKHRTRDRLPPPPRVVGRRHRRRPPACARARSRAASPAPTASSNPASTTSATPRSSQ